MRCLSSSSADATTATGRFGCTPVVVAVVVVVVVVVIVVVAVVVVVVVVVVVETWCRTS